MSSSNSRTPIIPPGVTTTPPYFFITITNYPDILQNTQSYQQSSYQYRSQQHQEGMLIPGVAVHFGLPHTNEHERLLYNTLRYQLQEAVRSYLHRTRQLYPICLFFDMTGIERQQ